MHDLFEINLAAMAALDPVGPINLSSVPRLLVPGISNAWDIGQYLWGMETTLLTYLLRRWRIHKPFEISTRCHLRNASCGPAIITE